ncbi:DEKNAAC102044 [Brettanomyces naardenensis]|uniref:DEKNAAC102044 n=1 Tax=Brettanomyces naardenensis TaxID=13370 RepID=A0A448YJV0_BRENA|nr:DEKNAAC102044 [Brettanomyces naardenensis]
MSSDVSPIKGVSGVSTPPDDGLGQIGLFDFSHMFDGSTKHAADAMDFSDEDELAEEDEGGAKGEAVIDDVGARSKEAEDETVQLDKSQDQQEEEEGSESDDLMKELEEEGMKGVEEDEAIPGGLFGNSFPGGGGGGLNDLELESAGAFAEMDEDEEAQETVQTAVEKPVTHLDKAALDAKLLRIFYPTFQRGHPIKMQTLFPVVPLEFPYQATPRIGRPLIPTKVRFEIQNDSRKTFRLTPRQLLTKPVRRGAPSLPEPRVAPVGTVEEEVEAIESIEEKNGNHHAGSRGKKRSLSAVDEYDRDMVLANADWDDVAILEGSKAQIPGEPPRKSPLDVNMDDWDEGDNCQRILDGQLDLDSINLRLDLNDPRLLLEDEEKKAQAKRRRRIANTLNSSDELARASIPLTAHELDARFNISNDSAYDILRRNYHTRVRSTIGNLTIEHAPPALRLQSPFYPAKPSAKLLRRFHRPRFAVRSNTTMLFSRPKQRKRKRDRGKDASQLFLETGSLTAGDTAPLFFLEYSEEYPVALSKLGMGSKLINYYRKMAESDTSRPKLPVGETHVLGLEDRSPFWNFGFVERGNIVPTLYNQMVRAPVFRHDAAQTDFLLVRSAGAGGSQRYCLRSISNLFTVGQTFPAVEVPGPHSRKVSAISKNRLKMVVYRILNSDEHQRLLVKDISRHFPEHSDMQNRQRLKEFMEYQRSGEDQGYWKVKGHEKVPDYVATRAMISPEDICLVESMRSAQQRFEDVESFRRERLADVEAAKREKEAASAHADESQAMELAPWNTTRNFIQATQGKAMLQIHGQGDISENGAAFSFLKISMKGGFLKNVESEVGTPATPPPTKKGEKAAASHSYNVAEQQKLYDEEIAKVWYHQQRALSSPGGHPGRARKVSDEELKDDQYMRIANQQVNKEVDEQPRYLKITRMVRNSYGILERRVEVVRDPKVVELYVRRRQAQLLEDPTELDSNSLVLTNDAEENLKVKKRLEEELAKLQKQHEKKKKKSPGITAANIDSEGRISGKGIGKGKSTSRRCATCGMLGHIRTNKSCPLYYTIHNKSNPNYIPGSEKSAHLLTIAQEVKK